MSFNGTKDSVKIWLKLLAFNLKYLEIFNFSYNIHLIQQTNEEKFDSLLIHFCVFAIIPLILKLEFCRYNMLIVDVDKYWTPYYIHKNQFRWKITKAISNLCTYKEICKLVSNWFEK